MSEQNTKSDSLLVIWTAADKDAAQKMVFMYTKNSRLRDWWGRVRLVVWGPSARLIAMDEDLQEELEDLKAVGVELMACRVCADMYGVTEELDKLGFDVQYMGPPTTEMLKSGWTCLTI